MYTLVMRDKPIFDFIVKGDKFEILNSESLRLEDLKLLSTLILKVSDLPDYLNSRRVPSYRPDREYVFGRPYKGLDYEVQRSYLCDWEDGIFARPKESSMTYSKLLEGMVNGNIEWG